MQTCPRCKQSLPANLKKCISCGTLLVTVTPQPPSPQQQSQEVSSKTVMGFPAPAVRAQVNQQQTPISPEAPKTMFGVGPVVGTMQPTQGATLLVEEQRQAPQTLYGVGAAAQTAPVQQPPIAPPPAQVSSSYTEDIVLQEPKTPSAPVEKQASPLGVANHNVPRPIQNTTLVPKSASSSSELLILGSAPSEIDPDTELQEPLPIWDAPTMGLLGSTNYFFSVIRGRVARARALRRLERECKQLETLQTYALSSLGFRALLEGSAQNRSSEQKANELIVQYNTLVEEQTKLSGTLGAELKNIAPKIELASQQITERDTIYRKANETLKQITSERSAIRKRVEDVQSKGAPAHAQDLEALKQSEGPHKQAMQEQAAAKTALQTAKTHLAALEKDQKQLQQKLANSQKQSSKALQETRAQLTPLLVSLAETLLNQTPQHQLAVSFQPELAEIREATAARKGRIALYRQQILEVESKAFQQGGLLVGGCIATIFVVLAIIGSR